MNELTNQGNNAFGHWESEKNSDTALARKLQNAKIGFLRKEREKGHNDLSYKSIKAGITDVLSEVQGAWKNNTKINFRVKYSIYNRNLNNMQ